MARLRVTSGPGAGNSIEINGQIVLGRHDADYIVDDTEVSRRHAVVRPLRGGLEVEDLGSANGTFVDGQRIEQPATVGGGARIRLGTTEFAVEGVVPVQPTRIA